MRSIYGGLGKDYICPVCEKQFSVPFQTRGGGRNQWAYTRRSKGQKIYFCSYKCLCSWDKKEEKEN